MQHFPKPKVEVLDQNLEMECQKGVQQCLTKVYSDALKMPYGIESLAPFTYETGLWTKAGLRTHPPVNPTAAFTYRVRHQIHWTSIDYTQCMDLNVKSVSEEMSLFSWTVLDPGANKIASCMGHWQSQSVKSRVVPVSYCLRRSRHLTIYVGTPCNVRAY